VSQDHRRPVDGGPAPDPGAANPWYRALRVAFGIAAIGFLAIAFVATVEEVEGSLVPPLWALLLAAAAQAVALWATQRSWAALLPEVPVGRLAQGFYVSHLGKYIPGAVWQPLGQVGYAVRDGVEGPRAASGYLLHAIASVAAMGIVGSFVLVLGESPGRLVVAVATCGLISPVFLHRGLAAAALAPLGRWIPAVRTGRAFPSQTEILRAFGWAVAASAASGLGFGSILVGVAGPEVAWLAVPGYALSWLAGFVAIPVPAGIGVREAVMVAVFGGFVPVATVVAASVYQRLVSMIVEAAFATGSSVARRARAASPGAG
jgi:glycosyltransferase 2 family protein